MTARELAESRFPVGSSASRSLGSFTSARATAARCCSPCDSSAGLMRRLPPSPTRSRRASIRSAAPRVRRAIRHATRRLSSTSSDARRLNFWKTNPTVAAAVPRELRVAAPRRGPRRPPRSSRRSARSMPPMTWSRVDFPQPDGPITAVNAPRATSRSDAAQRQHGRSCRCGTPSRCRARGSWSLASSFTRSRAPGPDPGARRTRPGRSPRGRRSRARARPRSRSTTA